MSAKKFRKSEKNQCWFLAMFPSQLQKYAKQKTLTKLKYVKQ